MNMKHIFSHPIKKISKIIFLPFSALLFHGCSDSFLEVTPSYAISKDDVFTSEDKINAAMVGIYELLSTSSYIPNRTLTADVKGEDVLVNSTNNYGRFIANYQYIESVNNGFFQSHWDYAYRIITNCNQMIDALQSSSVLDTSTRIKFIAEARALRAFQHYNLTLEFAKAYSNDSNALGIPIVDKVVPYAYKPSRNKINEVYASIRDDLHYAEQFFPQEVNDVYKITRNSIQGMLARVYLDMENWEEAARYAKLARNSHKLSLASDLLGGFNAPTTEWIWAINQLSNDNNAYSQAHSYYDPYGNGYSSFRADSAFLALFDTLDVRYKQFIIREETAPTISGNGYLISKFFFTSSDNATLANDQVLMRSSEMYLIEAEAEARLGKFDEAQKALLAIRQRALPSALQSTKTGQNLIDEIWVERRKELFGEGFRFYDIKRTKATLVRTGPFHWSTPENIGPGSPRMAQPIPQAETNANPNIVQNPGY